MKLTAEQALAGTRSKADADRDTVAKVLVLAEAAIKRAMHNGADATHVNIAELQISESCAVHVLDVLSDLGFSCSASTRSMVYATLCVSWAEPTSRN